jgi:hypothetical protein
MMRDEEEQQRLYQSMEQVTLMVVVLLLLVHAAVSVLLMQLRPLPICSDPARGSLLLCAYIYYNPKP